MSPASRDALLVDSIRALVPCQHRDTVSSGEKLWVNPDGEYFSEGRTRVSVPSPHGTTISVRSVGESGHHAFLEIEGSPAKFLQGHNLFGTCDLTTLLTAAAEKVTDYLGLSPSAADIAAWHRGEMRLSRVDCTAMSSLGSRRAVDEALEILKTGKHRVLRSKSCESNSVYFGKQSRHLCLKIYGKGAEIEEHPIPTSVPYCDELTEWADDKLRFEVVLRGRKLKQLGLTHAYDWSESLVRQVLDEQLHNVLVNDSQEIHECEEAGLSGKARALYCYWLSGGNPKNIYKSRHTIGKYRKEILDIAGLDIAVPYNYLRATKAKTPITIHEIILGEYALVPGYISCNKVEELEYCLLH